MHGLTGQFCQREGALCLFSGVLQRLRLCTIEMLDCFSGLSAIAICLRYRSIKRRYGLLVVVFKKTAGREGNSRKPQFLMALKMILEE